jgi:hypothetical protein
LPAFLFDAKGEKRNTERGVSRSVERAQGSAFGNRDLFEKRSIKNFQWLCVQYNKIKSFHGSDELSVKASLEKLLIIKSYPHKPTLMQ